MKDLFEEPTLLPQEVQDVIMKFEEGTYEDCAKLVEGLNAVGYTCEYYLDASPFGLRKVIRKGNLYTLEEIERFSTDVGLDEADYYLYNAGRFAVGQNLVILDHKKESIIMSFLLSGATDDDEIVYECVYTDLKE